MEYSVWINSLVHNPLRGVIVTAANGSPEGPPMVRVCLPTPQAKDFFIGQRLKLTIEIHPDDI